MKRIILPLILSVTTIFGLAILFIGIPMFVPALGLNGEAQTTTATVVGKIEGPLVEFTTTDGKQERREVVCIPFDCYLGQEIGGKVPIIYLKNFTGLAIADNLMGRVVTPLFIFIIGLVFTLPGPIFLGAYIDDKVKRSPSTANPADRNKYW